MCDSILRATCTGNSLRMIGRTTLMIKTPSDGKTTSANQTQRNSVRNDTTKSNIESTVSVPMNKPKVSPTPVATQLVRISRAVLRTSSWIGLVSTINSGAIVSLMSSPNFFLQS